MKFKFRKIINRRTKFKIIRYNQIQFKKFRFKKNELIFEPLKIKLKVKQNFFSEIMKESLKRLENIEAITENKMMIIPLKDAKIKETVKT